MTDAEIAALVRAAKITDYQLQKLASGHIVLWKDEGVRGDEREACAQIADGHLMEAYSTDVENAVKSIAADIRSRKPE